MRVLRPILEHHGKSDGLHPRRFTTTLFPLAGPSSAFLLALFLLWSAFAAAPLVACTAERWSKLQGADGIRADTPLAGVHRYSGACGLRVTVDGAVARWLEDQHPSAESHYIARFYVYWGDVVMGSTPGDLVLLSAYDGAGDKVFSVGINDSWIGERIYAEAWSDDGGRQRDVGDWLFSGWRAFEVEWIAADGGPVDNGRIVLRVDGTVQAVLEGLDNSGMRIETVRLGAVDGAPALATGHFDLDAFASRRGGVIDSDGDQVADAEDDDDDNDGLPDSEEIWNALDPLSAADALQDSNGDGISNLDEYLAAIGFKWILRPGQNLVHTKPGFDGCKQLLSTLGRPWEAESLSAYLHVFDQAEFDTCDYDTGADFSILPSDDNPFIYTDNAYWVYMLESKAIPAPRQSPIDCPELYLQAGLNMVGLPIIGDSCISILFLLSEWTPDITVIQHFNTVKGAYESCAASVDEFGQIILGGDDFPILPGEGYIISTKSDTLLPLCWDWL